MRQSRLLQKIAFAFCLGVLAQQAIPQPQPEPQPECKTKLTDAQRSERQDWFNKEVTRIRIQGKPDQLTRFLQSLLKQEKMNDALCDATIVEARNQKTKGPLVYMYLTQEEKDQEFLSGFYVALRAATEPTLAKDKNWKSFDMTTQVIISGCRPVICGGPVLQKGPMPPCQC